ncbi:MAG: type II toxin-antitoxin system PemK/MazF family toxin [Gordonia sp. (in: high G+C Gram-positive bacteria)]
MWVDLGTTTGREQAGRRPALVVAGRDYLRLVDTLAVVVPLTTVDRGWPNHVPVAGGSLDTASWAMTEQVRTVSRERVTKVDGVCSGATMVAVRRWLSDFLELNRSGAGAL